jgi:hypothetical protein
MQGNTMATEKKLKTHGKVHGATRIGCERSAFLFLIDFEQSVVHFSSNGSHAVATLFEGSCHRLCARMLCCLRGTIYFSSFFIFLSSSVELGQLLAWPVGLYSSIRVVDLSELFLASFRFFVSLPSIS